MQLQKLVGISTVGDMQYRAPARPFCQGRTGFHREAIRRHVIHVVLQQQPQVAGGIRFQHLGKPEDHVHGERRQTGGREEADRPQRVFPGVDPMHPFEHGGIQGLDAKRDAVHAGGEPLLRILGANVIGVHLHRHLDALSKTDLLAKESYECGDVAAGEQRRGAAAEVEGFEGFRRRARGQLSQGEFPLYGFDEFVSRHFLAHGDGEITVRAAPFAEGDVDVQVHGGRYGGEGRGE